ncbi:MAG TPA: SDR family oxidoreductase [Pseudomonas sp.]|jgi:3-oxoacyl-[acyl-carrier protein] reductase
MKKVVVTGAANGIGRATAAACMAEGFYVIAADKDADGLRSLQRESGSEQLEVIQADFADASTIKSFMPQLYARHESLSGLVNNAGLYRGQSVFDYSDAQIDELWALNLKSLVYLSREFARREMSGGGRRSIVNITSVAGEVGSFDAMYGATKAGVIGLTKANAWNFAPSIRVNAVSPGLVRNTSIYQRIPEHRRREYERQEILKEPIQPSAVADVIVFLLGEKSRHLTGQVIAVDNGVYPR